MRTNSSRLLIALLVAATLAYYFWTAMISAGGPPRIHGEESDHFNLLSRGFRKGQLHLDAEVPAGLSGAPNPYDPKSRGSVPVLHDASYFRGRYYIYFGPAPVVTLLLPFRLLTGRDLPLAYAVWVYTSFGYLALAGLFRFLQQRHFPQAGLGTVAAGLIAIGGASLVVALLRRSNIWELSGASGFCFFSTSLYCLIRALHSPHHPRRWATAGGLALGLAVASRPTFILGSVLFALPLLFRTRAGATKDGYDGRALLGAAVSCGLPVLGLLAYNQARFGEWLEFGLRYQLTSVIESESRHFSLAYVPFNFHVYFLSLLHWVPAFPFVTGIDRPPLPPGHGGHEYSMGLFANLPFAWFSLLLFAGLTDGRGRSDLPRAFWLGMLTLAGAAAVNAALLLCFFGSCIRYMVDFTPSVMLLAAFGVLAAEARLRRRVARLVLTGCAIMLAVFSAFTAAAVVVNFYPANPGDLAPAYHPVARVLNYPIFRLQQQRWPDYGPREIAFTLPADRTPRQEALATVSRAERTTAIVLIDYLDERRVRLGYREPGSARVSAFSPAVAAPPGTRHTLRLSLGGPYADFNGARGRLRAEFDHIALWDVPLVSFGAYPGSWDIGRETAAGAAAPRFTGEIHAARPVAMPETARPQLAGIRVRLTLRPEMTDRAYPLITSGRTKAGDLFFVRVHPDGKISFGYDHWGDALLTSPEVTLADPTTAVVEFWVPALAPPGAVPALHVRVDGATVWQQAAPAFPSTPETQFIGRNPIRGSTCETELDHAVFEDLHLPLPAGAAPQE
jgi:hypothetical protein